METIESVQTAVLAWRRKHRWRRGPLPMELRRRAGALAHEVGDEEASTALEVRLPAIRRWREQHAPAKVTAGRTRARRPESEPTFVELKPLEGFGALSAQGSRELLVEVTGADGRVVRIRGALDAAGLEKILRCVVQADGGR